jgi:hypothetical protein
MMLVAVVFIPASGAAQDIAGKWTVEYPRTIRNVNGAAQADEMSTAILTLEVKGDSIVGSWLAQNSPNPTPRTLRGTIRNGMITLIGDPTEATIRRASGNGGIEDQSTVRMITFYEGTVKDGVIEGTFRGESEDKTVQMPSVKWKASRKAAEQ